MNRRERILLILVGTIGVLLVSYFYIYTPRRTQIRNLETQLADLRAQRQRMEFAAAQITRLREQFRQLQAFIADIETKLPAEKEIPALLVQLERLTQSLGVNFQSIRPSALEQVAAAAPPAGGAAPPPAGQPPAGGQAPAGGAGQPGGPIPAYLRLPIALSVEATFEELVRLVTALNDFPRMIAVRNLSMSPRKFPDLGVSVDVETYVLPRGAR